MVAPVAAGPVSQQEGERITPCCENRFQPGPIRWTAPFYDFVIGYHAEESPFFGYFQGDLDELRIYNRAITPAEVFELSSLPLALCQDVLVEADASCGASISPAALDAGSYAPNGDPVTFSVDINTVSGLAAHAVMLTATGPQGAAASCTSAVTVFDGTEPSLMGPNPVTLEAGPGCQAAMPDLSTSYTVLDACDPTPATSQTPQVGTSLGLGSHLTALSVTDSSSNTQTVNVTTAVVDSTVPVVVVQPTDVALDASGAGSLSFADIDSGSFDVCGISSAAVNPSVFSCSDVGVVPVTATLADGSGNVSSASTTVTVIDGIAPAITCAADFTVSANNSCQAAVPDFAASALAADACGINGVTQDLLVGSLVGLGASNVTVQATDASGNLSACVAALTVVDTTAGAVSAILASPNPVAVGTPFQVEATIVDLCTNIIAAEFSLDGGSTFQVMDPIAVPALSVQATATVQGIPESTVLSVCARGTDSAGNTSSSECTFLPVFDPEGAFVTGSGWIHSPPGAYAPDPSLQGKAMLGFVSRYRKGANAPTGVTQFRFRVANFDFRSDSYQWLVVANAKAMFKGSGSINGENGFKFMISAIDGDLMNDHPDTFRIRIWQEVDGLEEVIYDNQLGGMDHDDPTTALGGGSIVIH